MTVFRGVFLGAVIWVLLTLVVPFGVFHPIFVVVGWFCGFFASMLGASALLDWWERRKW